MRARRATRVAIPTPSRRLAATLATVLLLAGIAGAAVAASGGPDTRFVFVARGDDPVDVLAAAPIAGRLDAPVLLTPPSALAEQPRQGLVDHDPDVVIVAGGTDAVSASVQDAIGDVVPDAQVRRVSGATRYDTAERMAALVREYEPAFSYDRASSDDADTNAFGIACPGTQVLTGISADGDPVCADDTDTNAHGASCPPGQLLSGISSEGAAQCAADQVDGGDAATVSGVGVEHLMGVYDTDVDAELNPYDEVLSTTVTIPDGMQGTIVSNLVGELDRCYDNGDGMPGFCELRIVLVGHGRIDSNGNPASNYSIAEEGVWHTSFAAQGVSDVLPAGTYTVEGRLGEVKATVDPDGVSLVTQVLLSPAS